MAEDPWLTIIGLGEDGPDGLPPATRRALDAAEVVMGPPRHLSLLPDTGAERIEWPVPFADGIDRLLALKPRRVAALASGDPFWFGAGTTLAKRLAPGEWRALPGPSTFSLAAARLGWPLDGTACLGLHAAPLSRLRPMLAPGARAIVLLRDGNAVGDLATYLTDEGFGPSALTILESLGGPRERLTRATADALPDTEFHHPVAVAIDLDGGPALPLASGRPDDWFANDGQITKRPVRALTLSALAPKPFEHLWDIGGGSGSIAIEWLLSHPTLTATTIEPRADRAATIRRNADRIGTDRLEIVTGAAPDALTGLPQPDAVFIGGGLDRALLDHLTGSLAPGTRLVANAVTLETEALLLDAHARLGGDLLRVDISRPGTIGTRHGWQAAYPILQWSHSL